MSDNFTFGDRSDRKAVEVGFDFSPKFDEHGLIPAIAQDNESGQVLMVAYMNDESLRATIEKGEAVYYSRSRQQLWHKGGTSGHVQTVHEILTDCDQDALVVKVTQHGPGCCHAGYQSCFYRSVPEGETAEEGKPLELKPVYSEQSYDPAKVYG